MFASLRKKPFILLGVALTIIVLIIVIKMESSNTTTASNAKSEEIIAEADTDKQLANEDETEKSDNTDVQQKAVQEPDPVQTQEKVEKDTNPINKEESNKQNTKEKTTTPNNSQETQSASQPKGNIKSKKDDFSGIDTFWKKFRNAVLANNMSEVKKMTQFPLSTRGLMDTDPIIKVNQDKFDKTFQTFLYQDDGLDGNSVIGYIRNAENLNFKSSVDYDNSEEYIKTIRVDNNNASIASMVFKLINGEWRLTLIYTDNKIG